MLRHAWLNLWQKHIILAGSTRYYNCAETLVAHTALPWDSTAQALFVFAWCLSVERLISSKRVRSRWNSFEFHWQINDISVISLLLDRYTLRYFSVTHWTVFIFPFFLEKKIGFSRYRNRFHFTEAVSINCCCVLKITPSKNEYEEPCRYYHAPHRGGD